jgi:hypothetical protein
MLSWMPSSLLGIFDGHSDVGDIRVPGSATFDGQYRVSGSGYNMWFAADAFQFVWKKISGDVSLSAVVDLSPKP